jgi:hypothetical protein
MARVTPEQAAQKWASRLSGATTEIQQGVNSVTVAPGVAAARQKDVWLAKVTAAKDKWASRVASVPLQEWQQKMLTVGVPRIAQGASANQGKVDAFMAQFLPHLDAGVAKIKAMPKATLADSIQRAVAMIQHNAEFRRK